MKTMNKVISILMCLSMTLLSACSSDDNNPGSAQTSVTTTENLDNEVDYSGMAEGVDEIDESNIVGAGPKFDPSKTAGHVKALCYHDLDSAEMHEMLAQKFGGTLETELTPAGDAYYDKIGTLVSTGNSPDIVRFDWITYPNLMAKNMYTPLDDWIDIDSDLWVDMKEVINNYSFGGKHYYYPHSVEPNFVIIYNQANIESAGLADPVELYKNNNWTWDTFKELISKWANMDENHIGFTGGGWTSMMFANTAGVKFLDITDNDIINNFRHPDVERTMTFLSEMKKNNLIGDGYVNPGEAFVDGNLLFLAMGMWGYTGAQETFFNMGIMEDNHMVELPFPRDPQADKYYQCGTSFGYLVPAGAPNIQGGVSWILCNRMYETDPEVKAANYARDIDTTPVYYDKCPGCKYDFPGNDNNDLNICPECNTARKAKYKATWGKEEIDILQDMKDPTKFSFIFDPSVGFGSEMDSILVGGETSVFDGPIYYASSYTSLIESQYQAIESIVQPYRDTLAKASAE